MISTTLIVILILVTLATNISVCSISIGPNGDYTLPPFLLVMWVILEDLGLFILYKHFGVYVNPISIIPISILIYKSGLFTLITFKHLFIFVCGILDFIIVSPIENLVYYISESMNKNKDINSDKEV